MTIPYNKPYQTLDQQIALLQSRGMAISDIPKAKQYLQRLGYYRLSGCWYPFRESKVENGRNLILDNFKKGTEFGHAVDLYVFDKKLRLLFMDALERIEVAVRVDIALTLGLRSQVAHRDPALLDGLFTKKIDHNTGNTFYADWLTKFDQLAQRSKEDFVIHFKNKYNTPLPIWVAIELWDFGLLSKFLSGINFSDRSRIAARYSVMKPDVFTSWIRSMNHVRNICAHHSRLWNRSPSDQPKLPQLRSLPILDHLVTDRYAQTRLYAVAAVMQFILRTINPSSAWSRRLKDHMKTFPVAPGISVDQTGFPAGWESLPLWK